MKIATAAYPLDVLTSWAQYASAVNGGASQKALQASCEKCEVSGSSSNFLSSWLLLLAWQY